jgi:RHS repeat-associated protein
MPRRRRARRAPVLVLLSALLAAFQGVGCPSGAPLGPAAGVPEYQQAGLVAVPFGLVNTAGGNLILRRTDVELDSRLGPVALGATWNSADGLWRRSFELSYDGATFVDAGGARFAVAGVAAGRAVPGSVWVKLDDRTLATKGGLVHEFDGSGRLAAIHWSSGAYPRLEYRRDVVAGASRVTELWQDAKAGDGVRLARFGYDAAGRLVSVEDRSGRRAELSWNAAGQLAAARSPLDVQRGRPGFRYEYEDGNVAGVTSSDGVRAEFRFAGRRVVAARSLGEGDPRIGFVYASLGSGRFRTAVADPEGHVSLFVWDLRRRLLSFRSAEADEIRWTWGDLRPLSRTDPGGVVTAWSWSDDDPVEERQPSGNVVTRVFEAGAENREAPARRALRSAGDRLGPIEERRYDSAGRLVERIRAGSESWTLVWNADNLLGGVTDPSGIETRYRDYGAHGHPRRIERAGRGEDLDYDSVGNLRSGGDSALLPGAGTTGVVSRHYDADRRLDALVLGDLDGTIMSTTRTLSIEYRSDGQPLRVARPYGGDTEFVYDALGRLVLRRDRAGGLWRDTRFERDAAGRVTAVERPNGMREETAYDDAGRVVSLGYRRSGAFASGAAFAFAGGRLASIVDSAHGFAPETYEYDAAGRVRAVRYPDGERLELAYDLRSRVVGEHYLSAGGGELRSLRFEHDLADREVAVRDGDALLRELVYGDGRLVEERLGNGLVRSWSYGADGLMQSVVMRDAAGLVVERSALESAPGLESITWHASTESFGGVAASSHEHFTLAPLGPALPGPRVGAYASDAAGQNTRLYSYDVLGNLLASAPNGGGGGSRSYRYDAEHVRLLEVRRASGAVDHAYRFDEAGFAVERDGEAILWDAAGRPISAGSEAGLAWDTLGRPLSVTRYGVTERRLFGGRVRATAEGLALGIDLGPIDLDFTGDHRYRHLDFRGNVKLVSDAAGRIVGHLRYGPYGADRVDGVADPEAGFAGGGALGDLLLLGARLYDPAAARFLAPDPVFQLLSPYAYAGGNPVWFRDSDGRSARAAVGFATGVALVGVAVAGVTGNVPLLVVSVSFAVGLFVPPSMTGAAVGGGLAVAARAGGLGPVAWALGAGFAAGQSFQAAANNDFDGLWDPFGDKPRDVPRPRPGQGKDITVGPAPATISDARSGGPSFQGPSCSPASLTAVPPAAARRALAALLGVQLALGLALWHSRGRR